MPPWHAGCTWRRSASETHSEHTHRRPHPTEESPMRLFWTFVLAALSAMGAPLAASAQLTDRIDATAKQNPTFVGCPWQELGRFPGLVPRAVAIGRDGAVLLAADDVSDPARSALVVRRQAAAGAA